MAKKQTPESQAVVKWDSELAELAKIASGMEDSVATGQFFSIKGGILSWNDAPLPGNQMAVVILDAILENVFYAEKFNPEVPQSPLCFAFGRDDVSMRPHELVVKAGNAQCDECKSCRYNAWGTADQGRGKACRNTRRLAMIPAGTLDPQTGKFTMFPDDEFEKAGIGYMKLPVTSVKPYAGYVKQLAGVLKRPPFAVITKVRVVPDPKTQFKVLFEPLQNAPDQLISVLIKRNKEVAAVIDFPYVPFEDAPAAPKPAPPPPPRRPAPVKRGRQ